MDLYDVIIIGGGPSGSTAATHLVRMGWNVLVLEKEFFPREHVGESLIPATHACFSRLGVLEELNKIAPRKPGVHFINSDGGRQSLWCFNKVVKDESYLSYHVKRSVFDELLLNHSKKNGARVIEGTAAKNINLDGADGSVVVETVNSKGLEETFRARFLIDASGQSTFLGSKQGVKKSLEGLDRVAMFTHWAGVDFDPLLKEGVIKIVYLGGEKIGWSWVIPISADNLSVGIVMNNSFLKQERAKFRAAGETDWKKEVYLQEIENSPALTAITHGGTICHNVQLIGDYSYRCETKYGKNYAIIGDAGAFLDPIFSSGIFVGMRSAEMVSAAVNQWLKDGSSNLLDEAYDKIDGAIAVIEKFIRIFYNRKINFAAMGDPSEHLEYESTNRIYALFHFLLSGDFFEDHSKYSTFLDMMQNEKMIEKFLNLIKYDKNPSHTLSCGEQFQEMYGEVTTEIIFNHAQLA